MILSEQYVSEFVYGSVDGIITTLAIVAGSAGAGLSTPIIIILGLANVLADGFSMGVSRYLAAKTEQEIRRKSGYQAYPETNTPLASGVATMASFILVGMIPLLAFIIAHLLHKSGNLSYSYAYLLTAVALFLVGSLKSRFTEKGAIKSGVETLLIGGVGAIIAFMTGHTLRKLAT